MGNRDMSTSDSMKKAIKKYDEKWDFIRVRVPKGKKEEISSYAKSHGESVAQLINRLIDEEMEKKP